MTDFIEKNLNLKTVATHFSEAPFVAILLCTYNGARFLGEQLDSLEAQTHHNWAVIASDDGSSDQTLEILQRYQAKWPTGKLTIRNGPQKGFCQNFLSLACDPQIKADYYAFCDQDDVWLPEKISIALGNIAFNQQLNTPYLYCGRTNYVTDSLKLCGNSPLFIFPPSFRNALVQSIAGGNTMVFNLAAKQVIENAGLLDVPSHDWWLYILVSGSVGVVFYDKVAHILYRQHDGSLVGGNNTFYAKTKRLVMVLQGRFQNWNKKNITALAHKSELLSESNNEVLGWFRKIGTAGLIDRLRILGVCGLYRQTRLGTISLYVATVLNKL
jgi:glycosyltransferase involved in cell wall biosynthesis